MKIVFKPWLALSLMVVAGLLLMVQPVDAQRRNRQAPAPAGSQASGNNNAVLNNSEIQDRSVRHPTRSGLLILLSILKILQNTMSEQLPADYGRLKIRELPLLRFLTVNRYFQLALLAIDPKNPFVLWVGTGENNSQRNLAYGDGVYKTTDGGNLLPIWDLNKSEHIGKIMIDPRNSNTVYVAAQGPAWGPGGDRGLYKTIDGGKNWELILEIGPYTGVSDMEIDPRNPDIIYATTHQRERRVYSKINGGPESAIYKSEDAGKTMEESYRADFLREILEE